MSAFEKSTRLSTRASTMRYFELTARVGPSGVRPLGGLAKARRLGLLAGALIELRRQLSGRRSTEPAARPTHALFPDGG